MTRDEKKAKDRWEYVSDRLCNSDYPIYNEEHELESAFDAGVEWCEAHPNWISVEEELPPEDMPCLIYDERDGVQYASYRCFGKDFKDQSEWGWHINVTHWMPLPAPPKKGGER